MSEAKTAAGFKVVIPARYASTRLPGKPLADIGGRPMIERVAERAALAGADEVVIATDDQRVADAVSGSGHHVMLTRADHLSGSDRVMEVVARRGWSDDTRVINVQGDEPLIPPEVIAQVADELARAPDVGVATLCEPIADLAQVFDPNVVKVVREHGGLALYFSRAPIPYHRDHFATLDPHPAGPLPATAGWFRHIGIYGYRVATLRRFVSLPPSPLELAESLEQLRLLANGIRIQVAQALAEVPGGVDTPADLERVRRLVADG
ncbi:MAG: 3-deoxy-manno-octulosonate cytidylyltransferase [Pseudomonadales bacterium]